MCSFLSNNLNTVPNENTEYSIQSGFHALKMKKSESEESEGAAPSAHQLGELKLADRVGLVVVCLCIMRCCIRVPRRIEKCSYPAKDEPAEVHFHITVAGVECLNDLHHIIQRARDGKGEIAGPIVDKL